jgi:hypothetical protein
MECLVVRSARMLSLAVALCALADACTPAEVPMVTVTPQPSASATPSPTPAPGTVALTTGTMAFVATGAAADQSTTASQPNYSGTFAASGTSCTGIATISPAAGTTFTVTPVAAGSCTFTITGGDGKSAALAVGVTTTNVGGQ